MKSSRIGMVLFGLTIALAMPAPATLAEEHQVKFADCPAAVKRTFLEESKAAKIDSVTRETEEGRTAFWAQVEIGGRRYEIGVLPDGMLLEVSLDVDTPEIKFAQCPEAVRKTFLEEAKEAPIEVVGKDLKYGRPIYEAHVKIGGKEYEIIVAEDGTLLEKSLLIKEEEIELSDCPAPVRKTLREESKGANIDDVLRSSGIGGNVYEAEVEINGRRFSLEVDEGGALIAKTFVEEG